MELVMHRLLVSVAIVLGVALGGSTLNAADPIDVENTGSLVVQGDILTANTGDDSVVEKIKIYDSSSNLVMTEEGCYQTSCNFDISSLRPGDYTGTVFTSSGSFNDSFTVN